MSKKILFLLTFFYVLNANAQITIKGQVTDKQNKALEFVNVYIKGKAIGTITDKTGNFQLKLPKEQYPFIVLVSSVGYVQKAIQISTAAQAKNRQNITLVSAENRIEEVVVQSDAIRANNMQILKPVISTLLPNSSGGNVENLIKSLPGVSSPNELSYQYSVRGGNYDENLIYVNGVEIIRPQLIRSGQQEGMSFINSNLVKSIKFTAGGFDAKYGDKMSSVLDIKYQEPKKQDASISFSLLGGELLYKNSFLKKHSLNWMSSIRYRSSKYLLNSLPEKGDYKPQAFDFQNVLNYQLTKNTKIQYLQYFSNNTYNFAPTSRRTDFGTLQDAYNITIYFDGKESDQFLNLINSFKLSHQKGKFSVNLLATSYNNIEKIGQDINAEYFLNQLDKQLDSKTFGDSLFNLGTGISLNHIRNKLYSNLYNTEFNLNYITEKTQINTGISYRNEFFNYQSSEWEMIDSAGYSLPYNENNLELSYQQKNQLEINNERLQAFFQIRNYAEIRIGKLFTSVGLRFHYNQLTKENLVSPRARISFKPQTEKDIMFHFSSGVYYQTPFFHEFIDSKNEFKAVKSQKSIHFVLGADWNFKIWRRPFKISSETYYKNLTRLIPFEIDNLKISYFPNQVSKGYTYGTDFKISGEFVPGMESWFSLSYLVSKEDVLNDDHGYIYRPTDQRVTANIFFQDYLPGNDSYKFHLNLSFGTGLPYGPPHYPRYFATGRMPAYEQVNIGLSKAIIRNEFTLKRMPFKSIWISAEIYNLLGANNVASYYWVRVRPNQSLLYSQIGDIYPIPNFSIGRIFNLKFEMKF